MTSDTSSVTAITQTASAIGSMPAGDFDQFSSKWHAAGISPTTYIPPQPYGECQSNTTTSAWSPTSTPLPIVFPLMPPIITWWPEALTDDLHKQLAESKELMIKLINDFTEELQIRYVTLIPELYTYITNPSESVTAAWKIITQL